MHRRVVVWAAAVCAAAAVTCVSAAEGRTPVWIPGTVIAAPGKYFVSRNLGPSLGGGPIIQIMASGVDLDLNGMTLDNGGVAAAGILVAVPGGSVAVRNGTILNSAIGVDVPAPVQKLVLEDLRIEGTSGPGIHVMDPQSVAARRLVISDTGADGFFADGAGSKTVTVEDSHVLRTGGLGIFVKTGLSVALRNNRIDQTAPGAPGIGLDDCRSCLVQENTVGRAGGIGIALRSVSRSKIHNNTVSDAADHGISLDPGTIDTLVLDNVASDCGFGVALGGSGLFVEGRRNVLRGNVLNGNNGFGLRLSPASVFNTFSQNTARGNFGAAPGPCAGGPALFPPDSCNDGAVNTTFGDNLIPGPPVF